MQPQLTWNFCFPRFRFLSTQITDVPRYVRLNDLLVTLLPPMPSFDPCTEGASNCTLIVACLPCSFSFALAGASRLMLLPSGMYLPQASVASAVHRLLPWKPFPVRSSGHLTHRSYLYLASTSPVASPRNAPAPRNAAWRNPHCAACAVVAFPAARGQPCPTHLRTWGSL